MTSIPDGTELPSGVRSLPSAHAPRNARGPESISKGCAPESAAYPKLTSGEAGTVYAAWAGAAPA
jgi:hypothetical protein